MGYGVDLGVAFPLHRQRSAETPCGHVRERCAQRRRHHRRPAAGRRAARIVAPVPNPDHGRRRQGQRYLDRVARRTAGEAHPATPAGRAAARAGARRQPAAALGPARRARTYDPRRRPRPQRRRFGATRQSRLGRRARVGLAAQRAGARPDDAGVPGLCPESGADGGSRRHHVRHCGHRPVGAGLHHRPRSRRRRVRRPVADHRRSGVPHRDPHGRQHAPADGRGEPGQPRDGAAHRVDGLRPATRRRAPAAAAAGTRAWPWCPLTDADSYSYVLYDLLSVSAESRTDEAWVGVSAADGESYIPDELPADQPNGGRPGNESSIASVTATARYRGRPEFAIPPPLGDIPEIVADEPTGRSLSVDLRRLGTARRRQSAAARRSPSTAARSTPSSPSPR